MSLINDALKKARMEAARGEAAKRGIPYPALGTGHRPTSSHPWIAALVVTVVVAGIGGFLLYRAGQRAAVEQKLAKADAADRAATSPALDTSADPSEKRSQPSETLFEGVTPADAARPTPGESTRASRSVVEPKRPAADAIPSGPGPGRPATAAGKPPAGAEVPEPSAQAPTPTASAEEPRRRAPEPARESAPAEIQAQAQSADAELARNDPSTPRSSAEASGTAGKPEPSGETAESAVVQEFVRSAEIAGIGPVELGGIAWSGDRPFALVNGRVVRPGDSILGLVVDEILPNTVRLRGDAGTLVFRLK